MLGRLDLTAPWGLVFDPKPECCLTFFVVSRGSAVFETSDGDVRWLAGGDFVLMCQPTPLQATLRDHPGSPAVPARSVITPAVERRDCRPGGVFRHGGGGTLTNIIGGRIDIDSLAHNPLLRSLPAVIHVRGEQVSPASWLETTLQFIASEMQSDQPGAATVVSRLVDVLLVQAIRTHLAQSPQTTGSWLRALVDPQIGRALALIHEQPDAPWTVQILAERVAMSRSAFSARFSDLVGEPPLTYLTRWRMARATRLLQTTTHSLSEVAARVGYDADAAFSKAFKRWHGVAPGTFRRRRPPLSNMVPIPADGR